MEATAAAVHIAAGHPRPSHSQLVSHTPSSSSSASYLESSDGGTNACRWSVGRSVGAPRSAPGRGQPAKPLSLNRAHMPPPPPAEHWERNSEGPKGKNSKVERGGQRLRNSDLVCERGLKTLPETRSGLGMSNRRAGSSRSINIWPCRVPTCPLIHYQEWGPDIGAHAHRSCNRNHFSRRRSVDCSRVGQSACLGWQHSGAT